jgi:hypothetical protein
VNTEFLCDDIITGSTAVDRTESYIFTDSALVCSGEQFLLPEVIQHCQVLVSEGLLYIIWDDKRKMVSLDPKRRVYRELAGPRHEHVHRAVRLSSMGRSGWWEVAVVNCPPLMLRSITLPLTSGLTQCLYPPLARLTPVSLLS